MKKNVKNTFLFVLAFLLTTAYVYSQSKEELEKQRLQKVEEIKFTRKLIEETTEQQKQTLGYLNALNRQIQSRKELIKTMRSEIDLIQEQINEVSGVISSLENDLTTLKDEYAKMIYYAHKNKGVYTNMMYIFSSSSFNQAFNRMNFIRYYSQYRQKQIELIQMVQKSLSQKVDELQEQEIEKRALLSEMNLEVDNLQSDQSEYSTLVVELKDKEQELKDQLREQERIAERLNRAIEDIIKREMEEARKRAEQAKTDIPLLTPEQLKLSNEFSQNKAKLPWPVDQGIISSTYGRKPHPTLPGVITNNNGIDIQVSRGTTVKAIFNGTVSRIVNIPGANRAVIIRHGDYFTVYSNINTVYVNAGDQVNTGTEIGVIATNNQSGETILHFELWHQTNHQNPQTWLFKK